MFLLQVDHLARSYRLEELPYLEQQVQQEAQQNKEFWEHQESERIAALILDHDMALKHGARLARIEPDRKEFMDNLKRARQSIYKVSCKEI